MALVLDGTNGVSGVDGTASNPSLEGTDSNTGVFFPAADTWAVATGGTEALRVNSSQQLGLGVTSPAAKLDLNTGGASNTMARFTSNGSYYTYILSSGVTSVFSADTSGNNAVQIRGASNQIEFNTNGSQRMTLDASGNLMVGGTTARGMLTIGGNSTRYFTVGDTGVATLRFDDNGTPAFNLLNYGITGANQGYQLRWQLADAAANFAVAGSIAVQTDQAWTSASSTQDAYMQFAVALNGTNTERARIASDGTFMIGSTDLPNRDTTTGVYLGNGVVQGVRSSNASGDFGRLTTGGDIVVFRLSGTTQGSISGSGTTISYNSFAGSHWSQLQDGSKPEILRGTVMESINELCEWPDEPNTERLCRVKISDTEGSKKVYGVFMDWDNDWTATNDMLVTAVGAFVCRVNGSVTVQEGDLLESNGDGTARVQADDIIRSSTIGKVTCTTKTQEYDDGSYCVPTVLYCG